MAWASAWPRRRRSKKVRQDSLSKPRYKVLFEPAEEGGYVVTCPALPGLVTEGDTYEEAHQRVVEAIEGYLESLQKDGLPFPPGKK
jgi:antitoxin HicB